MKQNIENFDKHSNFTSAIQSPSQACHVITYVISLSCFPEWQSDARSTQNYLELCSLAPSLSLG